MKLIADGGAITKNATPNTRDAIILALNTPCVDGFKLKLYLTKDHKIVSVSDDVYEYFKNQIGGIENNTLHQLQGYNLGTNIHRQSILTLREILNIFRKYHKDLVLQLCNENENNALLIDLLLVELRPYKDLNIYLESESKEIISYLQSDDVCFQIGAVVQPNSLENFELSVDFFDVNITLLNKLDIRKKVAEGKLIMINQINNQNVFDYIYEEYQDIFDSIYIITNYISIIGNNKHFFG